MASSSSSLISLPLQLLCYTPSSSTRLRPGTAHRHYSPSARLQMQPTTKGRHKSVAVVMASSYEDVDEAAAGHGDDNGIAARTSLLRHVADEVAPPELLRVGGGAPPCSSPKGGIGPASEDDGSGGKIHHASAPTVVKRVCGPTPPGLPKEGSGGNGGSKH